MDYEEKERIVANIEASVYEYCCELCSPNTQEFEELYDKKLEEMLYELQVICDLEDRYDMYGY